MTNSTLKKQIAERRVKTGESYQAAHRALTTERHASPTNVAALTVQSSSFAARVERVITRAEADEHEATQRSRELGGWEAALRDKVRNGHPPAAAALLDELKSFDDADLRKLYVLMYAGREETSLRATHRQLGIEKPEIALSVIFSKRGAALPEYLRAALDAAPGYGTDLDAALPDRWLLLALSQAGVSDASLDRWDPAFLSLHPITQGISADPVIASRVARENAASGVHALDLGHEAMSVSREVAARLELFLTEQRIPFERRSLTRRWAAQRTGRRLPA